MTNKKIIIILLIIVVTLGVVLGIFYIKNNNILIINKVDTPSKTEVVIDNTNPPVFVWRYEEADSLNLDGQPKTNVFLDLKYSDGTTQEKLIATTDGGCNDLPDFNEERVDNSTIAQCYYAGLGYRFKIMEGTNSYLVESKKFEEGLPGSTHPLYEYQVILELPFSIK